MRRFRGLLMPVAGQVPFFRSSSRVVKYSVKKQTRDQLVMTKGEV